MEVLVSKKNPLIKIIYGNTIKYYSVSFFTNENNENNLIICISTQIGCMEKCAFCATGANPFVKNLTSEEIFRQVSDSLDIMKKTSIYENYLPSKIYVIFEGMGEASNNIINVLNATKQIYEMLQKENKKIIFRFSSVGNVYMKQAMINFFEENQYLKNSIKIEIKLSLHSPYNEERIFLCPNVSKKYSLKEIVYNFQELSKYFGTHLICNYMLLIYPNGLNNFTKKHLDELARVTSGYKSVVWLTKYSETDKNFKSPSDEKYIEVYEYLYNYKHLKPIIIELLGEDVGAACGMLDYKS